jgi:hypothetical protein
LASRFFPLFVVVAGLIGQLAIYNTVAPGPPIRSDGISYYVYLPSVVLEQSPRLWGVADRHYGGAFPEYTGIKRWPNTSWWLNPHPIGVALFMLPWFLLAHGLSLWSNMPPDGFSLYYQVAASLSGLFYGALGLWVLQRALTRLYPAPIVLATLVVITFGTNLFHYLTFDAGYSHAYGFALMAVMVTIVPQWLSQATRARSVALGITFGLLCLVRHSHALFALVPLLYGLGVTTTLRERLSYLWTARREVAVIAGLVTLLMLPQLALYYSISGRWLVSPYALLPSALDFDAFRVVQVLFSPEKGLFFWTPLVLLGLAGMATRGMAASFRAPVLVCGCVLVGLIASWYDWQFGGSFGHRGFTDALPLLVVPMAAALAWIRDHRAWARVASLVVSGAVALNVFQMLQYWRGVIGFSNTTWDDYVWLFLRWTP